MKVSEELFARGQKVIPGGVNSPVRAFAAVGGVPPFFARAAGAHLFSVDGARFVDFVCSWGAIIAGHARAEITAAVQEEAARGLGYGAPCPAECAFAETLCAAVPALEMARAVNSGTEATMSAIRLARGFTGRDLLVKFSGCYHGHADSLLVAAGSGAATLGKPSSAGVTKGAAADTAVLPYNDPQRAADFFAKRGDEVAAVIVEPIAGNMNMILPAPDFLPALQNCAHKHGALLIFDEVMTGFRVAHGGAQTLFNIAPDLSCWGKVIGGGLAVGAFGGRAEVMRHLAPLGGVYQAGTLSGNPVALAAGLAALKIVSQPGFYENLDGAAQKMAREINDGAAKNGAEISAQARGGMLGVYLSKTPPQNFEEMAKINGDGARFRKFFHAMLRAGFYLPPSPFEAMFLCAAHEEEHLRAAAAAMAEAAGNGESKN